MRTENAAQHDTRTTSILVPTLCCKSSKKFPAQTSGGEHDSRHFAIIRAATCVGQTALGQRCFTTLRQTLFRPDRFTRPGWASDKFDLLRPDLFRPLLLQANLTLNNQFQLTLLKCK